jgi:uncharacterized protein (TIGR02145 family)
MKSHLNFMAVLCMLTLSMTLFTGCTKEEETPYVIERGSVTDVDGNVYGTVKIGNQWWMAENLRVTAFNDGTPISYIPVISGEDSIWANVDSAAYCFINDSLFGYLYNAHTFNNGKNVAPAGWHVPTDDEWRELERTLGMSADETRQTGWRGVSEANALVAQYNVGWPANDQTVGLYGSDYYGFNALPSNVRGHDGRTNIQNNSAFWWCNSASEGQYYYRSIDTYHRRIFRQVNYPTYGMSIRCIKD